MNEIPEDHKKTLPFYKIFKDAHAIIISSVKSTEASFAISVYSALSGLANDKGKQSQAFSVPIGLIASRAGLSKRKTSDILKKLNFLKLIKIESGRGRKKFNTYTLLEPPPQMWKRVYPHPQPRPRDYNDYIYECDRLDDVDERAVEEFWDLQEKNNWKIKDSRTGKWEQLQYWKIALMRFNVKFLNDIENS